MPNAAKCQRAQTGGENAALLLLLISPVDWLPRDLGSAPSPMLNQWVWYCLDLYLSHVAVVLQCYKLQAIPMEQAKIRPSITLYSFITTCSVLYHCSDETAHNKYNEKENFFAVLEVQLRRLSLWTLFFTFITICFQCSETVIQHMHL